MAQEKDPKETAAWIESIIKDFLAQSPANALEPGGDKAWDEPLVGFARGDDPIFREIKGHVGDFFWLPRQALAQAHPEKAQASGPLSVIAWVLPQTRATKDQNAAASVYPSQRWAQARGAGEECNVLLRRHVAQSLEKAGYPAVAPMLAPGWEWQTSPTYGYASNWSERHAAHACGLGTFGLCDGLITPKGKAIRAGSVVAALELAPTPRPYEDHHAYCLYYRHGNCMKCVAKCPVKALSEQGHDKNKCHRHVNINCSEYIQKNYGFKTDACGLCQVGVPCESHIPSFEEG